MMGTLRAFLAGEAIAFGLASMVHAGLLVSGFEHATASTAEGVIAVVLVLGLVVSLVRPGWTRTAALAAQVFALVGTGIGIFAIVRGFGPQSVPDVVYHVAMVVVLVIGLFVAWRWEPSAARA